MLQVTVCITPTSSRLAFSTRLKEEAPFSSTAPKPKLLGPSRVWTQTRRPDASERPHASSLNDLANRSMLLIFLLIGLAQATCYLPNGSADSAPYIAQCPNKYDTQMCCWLTDLPNPDDCTTQGICLSNYNQDKAQYVDGCTDPEWGSGCSPLGKLCGRSLSLPYLFHGSIIDKVY